MLAIRKGNTFLEDAIHTEECSHLLLIYVTLESFMGVSNTFHCALIHVVYITKGLLSIIISEN